MFSFSKYNNQTEIYYRDDVGIVPYILIPNTPTEPTSDFDKQKL